MSKIEVDAIDKQSGSTLTLGGSGTAVTLASGATQTGFGRTGTVDWQTTPKTTGTFTAVSGEGYFLNTSGGVITANLPAGVAGAIVSFADYSATWQTSNVTVVPNGTDKIGSLNENAKLNVQGQSVTFVFVDSTQGWINTMDSTSNVRGNPPFIVATVSGACNTLVTSGNFKTAIFKGPGTFCVSCAGAAPGSNTVDYFVIAGGGGGGRDDYPGIRSGGGGGGGGFRLSNSVGCLPAPSMSPLSNPTGLPVSVAAYPITIGAGGAGGTCSTYQGLQGNNSIFAGSSTITSAGGGGGGGHSPSACTPSPTTNGGSGAGSQGNVSGSRGNGNTPPVSPPQGQPAGNGGNGPSYAAGGGGGAGSAGTNQPTPYSNAIGGNGGDGSFISDNFVGPTSPSYGTPGPVSSTRYFSGGGGSKECGTGGAGGGAAASTGTPSTVNTGGAGGGQRGGPAGSGGSGMVMIRYKFQ